MTSNQLDPAVLLEAVKQATERLRLAHEGSPADLDLLRAGFRDALDAGLLLGLLNDRGVVLETSLLLEIEALLRATLTAYAPLQSAELSALHEEKVSVEREARLMASLRSRALNAATALQQGLESSYRQLAEYDRES